MGVTQEYEAAIEHYILAQDQGFVTRTRRPSSLNLLSSMEILLSLVQVEITHQSRHHPFSHCPNTYVCTNYFMDRPQNLQGIHNDQLKRCLCIISTSNATTLTDVYFIPSYVRPQTPRFEGAGEALKRIDRKIKDKEKLNAARITLDDYLSEPEQGRSERQAGLGGQRLE